MGVFRKATSLFTMGAVDFRSDKERTAAYTKGIRRQARKQTKILKQQSETPEQRQDARELAARHPRKVARTYPKKTWAIALEEARAKRKAQQ